LQVERNNLARERKPRVGKLLAAYIAHNPVLSESVDSMTNNSLFHRTPDAIRRRPLLRAA
jgi:hypothetical protein